MQKATGDQRCGREKNDRILMSILMDEVRNRWRRRHLGGNYSSACRPKLFASLAFMLLEVPFSSLCTIEK